MITLLSSDWLRLHLKFVPIIFCSYIPGHIKNNLIFYPVFYLSANKPIPTVIIGGIITGYMSNLYPEINYSPKQNSWTHFVDNPQSITYLVEGLSKVSAVLHSIHSCESKESAFEHPLILFSLLNPMACDCKVTIQVWGLPGIAG